MAAHSDNRQAWNDRFTCPSLAELRAGLNRQHQLVFDTVRTGLLGLGLTEGMSWQGLPWRWTVVFGQGRRDGNGAPWFAYLVPEPGRVQVCIPLTRDLLARLPQQGVSPMIREAIARSRVVANVWWATWTVETKGAAGEVVGLARVKHALTQVPQAAAIGA